MVNVIQVCTWEECQAKIYEIEKENDSLAGVWFRGQSDYKWDIETTLERQGSSIRQIVDYYRIIGVIKPAVETFTGAVWKVPSFEKVRKWTEDYDGFSLKLWAGKEELAYDFLAHLRHQGFPSPLLDWTGSPYVAAYFAFAHAQRSERVAIYVFAEQPKNIKVGGIAQPAIHSFGSNVRTHKRHFRQQSRYTMCVGYNTSDGWRFVPHREAFDLGRPNQDLLWKIEIPASERVKVLGFLNRSNLNAFREIDLRRSKQR